MKTTIPITIEATPKLREYIQELVNLEHGYGETMEEVTLGLVWRSVNELVARGLLTRLTGPP